MSGDVRGFIDRLTSNFRNFLVGMEQEGQEYRKRLSNIAEKKQRRRLSTEREYFLSRIDDSNRTRQHISKHHRIMTSQATRGALIVLEGLDRVGKTTFAKRLVDHLEQIRLNISLCRFPDRTTPVGRLIDDYLQSSSKMVDNHVMHLLFSANRWEMAKKIRNTINQGTTVVVDRYSYSGIAYSSAKSDMDFQWCLEMERGLPKPDLVIFLDLPRGAQILRPGFGDERFETSEMQDLVRKQYARVMDISSEVWLRVDVERKSPDQILGEVILPVKRCLESCAHKSLGDLEFLPS